MTNQWKHRGKGTYTFKEVRLDKIECQPPERINMAEVKRLVGLMRSKADISDEDRTAPVLWAHDGKLLILEGAEKIVASIALGYEKGLCYVLDAPVDNILDVVKALKETKP